MKKIRFMHINKTVGKSILKWAVMNGRKIPDHQKPYKRFERDAMYFTLVRNPYDRIASQFYHWRDNLKRHRIHVELNEYVENIENSSYYIQPKFLTRHHVWYIKPCSFWFKDMSRFLIFKFENISKLETFFKDEYGFTGQLPHRNQSKSHSSYKHLYTDKSLNIIRELYKSDFDIFEYES